MFRCPVFVRHVLVAVIPCLLSATLHAGDGGGWHFNQLSEAGMSVVADHGEGRLELAELKGMTAAYEGTNLNADESDAAGSSLGVRGAEANGSWFEVNSKVSGPSALSFAYRSSATGFDDNRVQVWDGKAWNDLVRFGLDGASGKRGWVRVVVPLKGNEGPLRIRILLDGAESANGIIRFDNVRIGPPEPIGESSHRG